jgi:siroheme synthase
LYMPGADYAEVSRQMLAAGLSYDLPCVIVSNATSARQQIRRTTAAALAHEEKLPPPALLIVGRVTAQDTQEIGATYWQHAAQQQISEVQNSELASPSKVS